HLSLRNPPIQGEDSAGVDSHFLSLRRAGDAANNTVSGNLSGWSRRTTFEGTRIATCMQEQSANQRERPTQCDQVGEMPDHP
ncbi:MAG: hypothetical protein ACPLRM_05575, partial [Anaerolineae bacterium]